MKNLFCSVLSLLMLLGLMGTAALAQDTSLVLYLPFDEGSGDTVGDLSMYGNDGTLQNNPEWVSGAYGTALEFSGAEMNWVEVPDADILDITEELTIMAWVMNKGQTTYARIVDKNNPYMLYLQEDDSLDIYFSFPEAGWGATDAIVPRDTWTHVAATFDGTLERLYINGELRFTRESPGTIQVSENPLTIGNMTGGAVGDQNSGNNARPFLGAIDEVKVYNIVLSDGEIAEVMEPSAMQPSGKLAASWGKIKNF